MDVTTAELAARATPTGRHLRGQNLMSPDGETTATFDKVMRKVQRLTEQLVASTFLVPLLDRIQNDPFRSELMHGGFAEKVFQSQLNTQWADDMARAMDLSITRGLNEQFAGRIAAELQKQPQLANTGIDTRG